MQCACGLVPGIFAAVGRKRRGRGEGGRDGGGRGWGGRVGLEGI